MSEDLLKSLLLLVVGITGVFASLLFFAAMIWAFKRVDERLNARRIRQYARKIETLPPEDELNDEVVAVLTAAAVTAIQRKIMVRRIQFLGPDSGPAWAATGRLNIMASHLISRRKT
jgi:Na+-transporting methylmalonyl-CoA/oxaloacetate decarboxylase gamma subunit